MLLLALLTNEPTLVVFRLKKKDNDLLNATDRVHALEDELRNIGSKMSKLENDHHKVIQELNVSCWTRSAWFYAGLISLDNEAA